MHVVQLYGLVGPNMIGLHFNGLGKNILIKIGNFGYGFLVCLFLLYLLFQCIVMVDLKEMKILKKLRK